MEADIVEAWRALPWYEFAAYGLVGLVGGLITVWWVRDISRRFARWVASRLATPDTPEEERNA